MIRKIKVTDHPRLMEIWERKKLITYAIDNLQVTKVDVNEQNNQAVGFYKHIGFNTYKRSDLDGEGKEYPILHMRL